MGAYRTALGKLLLAFVTPDALDDHLPREPFPALTKRTITRRHALVTELEQIRRSGYALDNEEGDVGVFCNAVPVRRGSERVAALSVTGPAGEFAAPATERLLVRLREAAVALETGNQFHYAVQIVRRSLR